MEKSRVLFVNQEITPYLPESTMSTIGRFLPQGIQEKGKEIRNFMPRYGCINERRNQLHEVIRLSGMNLIIDDNDHPLIIKVASLQAARMQVYFIDNEDYFQRKRVFTDCNNCFFDDNDERSVFYCRGVLETIKKLGWGPDLIQCNGWFTSIIPLFIKKIYNINPLFSESKVIYGLYDDSFEGVLNPNMPNKIKMDGLTAEDLAWYKNPDYISLTKAAINFSDAVIVYTKNLHPEIEKYLATLEKPILRNIDETNYINAFSDFYDEVLLTETITA